MANLATGQDIGCDLRLARARRQAAVRVQADQGEGQVLGT